MSQKQYIRSAHLYYPGVLADLKKSNRPLQPLFEALTNAFEVLQQNVEPPATIKLNLYYTPSLIEGEKTFESMLLSDNGEGFTEENYLRFQRYKDNRKGPKNKGSGRIQYIHFFNKVFIDSQYLLAGQLNRRQLEMSKSKPFLDAHAILAELPQKKVISSKGTYSAIHFQELLDEKEQAFYNKLTIEELVKEIILHYLDYFCTQKEQLPNIHICFYLDDAVYQEKVISAEDIPTEDQLFKFEIPFKGLINGVWKNLDKLAAFHVKGFKVGKDILSQNAIKLTSKSELIDSLKLKFRHLKESETIQGQRYLFLLSSDYLDLRDSDTRGLLSIPESLEELEKRQDLFQQEEVVLSDLEDKINQEIEAHYPEIEQLNKAHEQGLEELKSMFLLSSDTIANSGLRLQDSEEKILEKSYVFDARKVAKADALLKKQLDQLKKLDPSSSSYQEELATLSKTLVKQLPLQNRAALSQYVARRKLVLDLFAKILEKELEVQTTKERNTDEKLLHNLLFQQSSKQPEISDLWILQEDFIYFSGLSEFTLGNITINGVKLLKEELSEDEQRYRQSVQEDRYKKRTDILLFPQEGKCIIIELKNPNVNPATQLNQISRYAALIHNLAKEEFNFTTFYGYLIGEQIDPWDVQDHDSAFLEDPHFDFLYRPAKPISSRPFNPRPPASLYTEVIKYSTVLKRAQLRNQIFVEKLLGHTP